MGFLDHHIHCFNSRNNSLPKYTPLTNTPSSLVTIFEMIGASSLVVALATAASPALATYLGFNYGSTFNSGAAKVQSDFEAEFTNAQNLITAPGVFNSARLYTLVVSQHWGSRGLVDMSQRGPSVLTPIPASRYPELAHRGHSSCHKHQDIPAVRHLGLRRRCQLRQRAYCPEVGHLHLWLFAR